MNTCETLGYLCLYGALMIAATMITYWAISEEKKLPRWDWTQAPRRPKRPDLTFNYIFHAVCMSTVLGAIIWAATTAPSCK
jgi:hypothetical protein